MTLHLLSKYRTPTFCSVLHDAMLFVKIHISLLAKDTMHVSNGLELTPYLQILINQLPWLDSCSVIQFCAKAFSVYADATAVQQIFGGTIQSLRGIKYLFRWVYKSPTLRNPKRLHHTSIEEIGVCILLSQDTSLKATLKPSQAPTFK
jgi:hypothetical protein